MLGTTIYAEEQAKQQCEGEYCNVKRCPKTLLFLRKLDVGQENTSCGNFLGAVSLLF